MFLVRWSTLHVWVVHKEGVMYFHNTMPTILLLKLLVAHRKPRISLGYVVENGVVVYIVGHSA